MAIFARVLRLIGRVELVLAVALLMLIVVSISAQVVLRYGWNSPVRWVEEASTASLIWITFLTGSLIYKEEAHIRIWMPLQGQTGIVKQIPVLISNLVVLLAAGIVILEGYGLTETSAGSFVNHPQNYRFGTVGPVFPGSEVKLGEGDEILIKGPGVMEGYHNLPEETAANLTDDGWLRTGDKGALDDDGMLRITGRIKELFKTSGGKYIAPPAIESKFKAICPYASQFMVFGNERNFCVALVTLDPDAISDWAKGEGISGDYAEIVASDACRQLVSGYIDELNTQLNRWETIKKWELLDHDLSVESGELTPSMKVKRNVVETNYSDVIDGFYS